jgi:hypothetical protein
MPGPMCRECGGYNTREGKKPARPCDALLAPGARADRGQWPSKPITGVPAAIFGPPVFNYGYRQAVVEPR